MGSWMSSWISSPFQPAITWSNTCVTPTVFILTQNILVAPKRRHQGLKTMKTVSLQSWIYLLKLFHLKLSRCALTTSRDTSCCSWTLVVARWETDRSCSGVMHLSWIFCVQIVLCRWNLSMLIVELWSKIYCYKGTKREAEGCGLNWGKEEVWMREDWIVGKRKRSRSIKRMNWIGQRIGINRFLVTVPLGLTRCPMVV